MRQGQKNVGGVHDARYTDEMSGMPMGCRSGRLFQDLAEANEAR